MTPTKTDYAICAAAISDNTHNVYAEFKAHFSPAKVKEMLERIAHLEKHSVISDGVFDEMEAEIAQLQYANRKLQNYQDPLILKVGELQSQIDRAIEVIKDYDGIAGWSAEKGVTKFSSASEFLKSLEKEK